MEGFEARRVIFLIWFVDSAMFKEVRCAAVYYKSCASISEAEFLTQKIDSRVDSVLNPLPFIDEVVGCPN